MLQVLNDSEFVGVRGPISYNTLKKIGFENTKVIGDPAFILDVPTANKWMKSETIAINIGEARARLFGNEKYIVDEISKVIKKLHIRFNIILFSMWPEDQKFLNMIPKYNNVTVRNFNPSTTALMLFFKKCYCVIGMKLHASILSAAALTPFISIGYREKNFDFAESVGLNKWVVRSDDKNLSNNIIKLVHILDNNYDSFLNKLFFYKKLYAEEHNNVYKLVKRYL
jgi:polysaccharide pyruvyl transferase WcaK-like protein